MLFLWSKAFETVKDVQIDRSTGQYRCMSTLVYQDLPGHLLQFGKKVCSSSHAAKLQPCVKFKVLIFQFGPVRIPKTASLSQGLVGIVGKGSWIQGLGQRFGIFSMVLHGFVSFVLTRRICRPTHPSRRPLLSCKSPVRCCACCPICHSDAGHKGRGGGSQKHERYIDDSDLPVSNFGYTFERLFSSFTPSRPRKPFDVQGFGFILQSSHPLSRRLVWKGLGKTKFDE